MGILIRSSLHPTRGRALLVAAPLLSLVALFSCKPDITGNTYFCGPEKLCPPDLACQLGATDTFAYNCVIPLAAEPFACPESSLDLEPDDVFDDAFPIGTLQCGAQLTNTNWGCIADGGDVDHFLVKTEEECGGANPRFEASLRFPIGTAPLKMDLLDSEGTLITTSQLCTAEVDMRGTELHCLEEPRLAPGDYYLRVSIDPDANADCGGQCRFNHYQVFAASPVL